MHVLCVNRNRAGANVIHRVGQNRIYTPYMTVYLVISLPKIPYIHRIYMVLANPSYTQLYNNDVFTSVAPSLRVYQYQQINSILYLHTELLQRHL